MTACRHAIKVATASGMNPFHQLNSVIKMKIIAALMVALASLPAVSHAENMAVTGKIGTLGYGAELNMGFSDSVTGRVGFNTFTYKYNANSNQVNYDFKLQLQTASALADWYPFSGSFRASGGLLYNNNKATLNAKPGAAGYTINGVPYTAAEIGSLQGEMSFNTVAPYLGIGWGNPVAKGRAGA
ncbi:MAG TPA: hypothetical protein VIH29_04600 [Gallionella sp.]